MMAMIPGTSRSGATIVGALALGVSRGVAAEFTFFLAIPVMFGASALKLFKFDSHLHQCRCFIAAWNACIVWSIDYCNQVPDEVYQKQ